jgi:sulfatase maturation enzyme AslB (radical SAM superfamily)
MDLLYKYYRAKYKFGQYLPLKKPVDISLELASNCNMACNYCYHSDLSTLPFKRKIMRYETAHEIINDAANIGVHSIKLNWRGEGTLNPNYREITELIKHLAHGTTFIDRLANSNFKIHPSRRANVFEGLANLTKVKVSYDSFSKDVFNKQRAGGDHDLTTENIDLFYNLPSRIKSETQLVIQAVRTNLNKDEDIEHLSKKRWPEAEISIRDMVAGRVESEKADELEAVKRDVNNRQPCKQAFVRLIYNYDGKAMPCCPNIDESLALGRSDCNSVKQIFNGDLAKILRKQLKSGKAFKNFDACKNCSSFESYKGYKAPWNS